MDVLMLRLDVYDETHKYILDFWKEITYTFGDDDAIVFTASFASYDDIACNISPELYMLCESYTNMQGTIFDLEGAQKDISSKLGTPKLINRIKLHFDVVRDDKYTDPEKKKLIEEYYEIEDSKKLLTRDMEKLSKVILKERQKLWNHIDILIVDSYKKLLYDITGSDEFAESFMKEMLIYGIMKDLSNAKRNRDYESISDIISVLYDCIEDWIVDVEKLVGV